VDHDSCGEDDPCWDESDDDTFVHHNNDHVCVDSPAPSVYEKNEDIVEDWGYTCYCACGWVFNMDSGTCESCMKDGLIFVENEVEIVESTGRVTITNDASRVFVKIDVDGTGFEIKSIQVNINNAIASTLNTRVNNQVYATDSKTRPNVDDFGVQSGIPLQKNFYDDTETAWLFSITMADVDFAASCNLLVMAHINLVCVDASDGDCTTDAAYEAWLADEEAPNIVNEDTSEWFSYMPYTPCGLSESVGGGHCKPDAQDQ